MNADLAPERAAETTVMVLFLLLPLWFFFKGLGANKRSARLANLALACGLLIFTRPEKLLSVASGAQGALRARAVLVAIAVLGIVLAVKALRVRAADGGTGKARPVIALVTCILLGWTSGGMIWMSRMLRPEQGPGREWTSERYGYRVRLPSSDCVEYTGEDKTADGVFSCGLSRTVAKVFVQPADVAAYGAAVQAMRARTRDLKERLEGPVNEDTRTEAGWPCARTFLVEAARDGKGPILVSTALVHWPEKGLMLTLIQEGQVWTMSDSTTALLRQSFIDSARALQRSPGPGGGGAAVAEQRL